MGGSKKSKRTGVARSQMGDFGFRAIPLPFYCPFALISFARIFRGFGQRVVRAVSLVWPAADFFLGRTCERTCIFEEPAGAGRTAAERGGATKYNTSHQWQFKNLLPAAGPNRIFNNGRSFSVQMASTLAFTPSPPRRIGKFSSSLCEVS